MSEELEKFQLNYDLESNQLAYNQALKSQIKAKIKELSKDKESAEKYELIIFRARYRVDLLEGQIKAIENTIRHLIQNHQRVEPYEGYKEDLEINKAALEARKPEFEALYSDLVMVSLDDEGIILAPKRWYLPLDEVTPLQTFTPVVTRPATSHSAEEGKNTKVIFNKTFNYSKTQFVYRDGGAIQNRMIMFWEYDAAYRSEDSFSQYSSSRFGDMQVGCTDGSGRLTEVAVKDWLLDRRVEVEGDGLSDRRYKLKYPMHAEKIGQDGDFPKPYRYRSNSVVNIRHHTAFFLYPLDQGNFLSKKVSDIAQLAAPEYAAPAESQDTVVFEGGTEAAPRKIHLHCTLPEWNHRLRERLTDLQQQINEFNLLRAPHFQKLAEVSQMQEMVDLHSKHAYRESFSEKVAKNSIKYSSPVGYILASALTDNEISPKEIEARNNLREALGDLHDGIESVISNPLRHNTATNNLWTEKKHIDSAAGELWELMQSPALYAEISNYIDHVRSLNLENDKVSAGPYMEVEESWYDIFTTIAECYAAFSESEVYSKLAWEKDIVFGMNSLGKMDTDTDKVDELILAQWAKKNKGLALDEDNDVLGGDMPEYLKKQGALGAFKNQKEDDEETIFNLVLKNYEELAKPYLSHILPGPGAPCTLQVVLSCYQPQMTKHIKDCLRSDLTYHIRFFKNVLSVFTIVNGRKNASTKLIDHNVSDIFKAFIVTKDTRASNKRSVATLKAFKAYFNSIDEDKGKSKGFYNNIVESKRRGVTAGASYGKSVYSLFNLALSIQYIQALAEKGKREKWPVERLGLEYFNSMGQIAVGVGASTKAILNIASRVKYLGLSNSVRTGMTGTIYASIEGSTLRSLGGLMDHCSAYLGIVQAVLSAYYAADHIKNNRVKEAVFSGISASAGVMLTAGFIMRATARRAASQLVVAGGTAVTGVGAPAAGVFLVVGTAVNILLLMKDVGNLLKTTLASGSQKYLVNCWAAFKTPLKPLDREAIEAAGLSLDGRGDVLARSYYSSEENVLKIYQTTPFEMYTKHYGGWSDTFITIEPIKVIEDIHKQDLMFDGDSVRLGHLSWRAVIPLYNMGIPTETIENMVKLNFSLWERYIFDGIETVKEIIDYYKTITKMVEESKKLDELTISVKVEGKFQKIEIHALLEHGTFTPPADQSFFQSERWQHDAYSVPDIMVD